MSDGEAIVTRQEPLSRGRETLARGDWAEARRLLSAVSPEHLEPEDLEGLAEAAWAAGDYEEALDANQRAHTVQLARGDIAGAAWTALGIAGHFGSRGDLAVAQGWQATADRLLDGAPECPAHARALYGRAQVAGLLFQDFEQAVDLARQAAELARRVEATEIEVQARNLEGRSLVLLGRLDAGMAILDETAAVAMTGRLLPSSATMGIACLTISTCQQVADHRRAAQWIDAYDTAAVSHGLNFSPDCRIHRAVTLRDSGSWARAEAEARLGCADGGFGQRFAWHTGWGWSEIGEIRLRLGDLDGAEEAFAEAHGRGYPPHPGLALLRLAQGALPAAGEAIRRRLAETGVAGYPRARLLEAGVRIAVAEGDLELACSARDELVDLAGRLPAPAIEAAAAASRGAVALAQGRPEETIECLRTAVDSWLAGGMPYEVARGRLELGRAHLAAGSPDAAKLELVAARTTFAQLGAVHDELETSEVLSTLEASDTDGPHVTVERAFMFTDIVRSTALAEAMGDEMWRTVLRRHDTLVDACVREHQGRVVKHEGDGVFAAFPAAEQALGCAVSIQTRLAEERATGFAPEVRIGVHQGSAITDGGDFFGIAINTAARIMALAGGGEIVASANAASAAGRDGTPREVELRGVGNPVAVVSVPWSAEQGRP